jgi:hypothetical protein
VFDRPAAQVSAAMLHALYATEGRTLPMQADELHLPPPVGDNVLPLVRPGCR